MEFDRYFIELEFRICKEIKDIEGTEFTRWWCDGVFPEKFDILGNLPIVSGEVCMARGGRFQWTWQFELWLPVGVTDTEQVNWASILPAENATGWLSMDKKTKNMIINPGAARLDERTRV